MGEYYGYKSFENGFRILELIIQKERSVRELVEITGLQDRRIRYYLKSLERVIPTIERFRKNGTNKCARLNPYFYTVRGR